MAMGRRWRWVYMEKGSWAISVPLFRKTPTQGERIQVLKPRSNGIDRVMIELWEWEAGRISRYFIR